MKLCSLSLIVLLASLSACDLLGIPDPAKEAERKDAEGKAIGGACRHAGRALEDCFALNPTAPKASVFAGWKDMNDYMAQNKIDIVKPEITKGASQASPKEEAAAPDGEADTDASAAKAAPSRKKGSKPGTEK
ncbi:hypothetical protein [Uliginosibacterium gangwonense]|uniref:hypothetical protein n=1 Tax=Uliginosibacterium gangwonense TaxID=392736 RepID=UPI0003804BBA|nr:hypothetical protein [Uliginosibacterium gangwonense]